MLSYGKGFIIFLLIFGLIYQKRLQGKNGNYIFMAAVMAVYLYLVACVTILPIDFTLDLKWRYHESINFVYIHTKPFHDLFAGYAGAKKQIVLNIIMTIPFGFLYTALKKKINLSGVIMATFLLSLTIECFQLLTTIFLLHHRSCDITDLITNVMGGIIGYWCYQSYQSIHRNKKIQS